MQDTNNSAASAAAPVNKRGAFGSDVPAQHTFKLISFNDARATCSCGGWNYACTGFASEHHMRHQFQYHLLAHGLDPATAFYATPNR